MVRLNLGAGGHPIAGWVNLDRRAEFSEYGIAWRIERGFSFDWSGTVEAISISHALMYVEESHWRFAFAEFYRVLEPGGVLRITEDDTGHPLSERRGGNPGDPELVTRTSPDQAQWNLERAGFVAKRVGPAETSFKDDSILQHWHGDPPKVFFIEGVKPC